MVAIPNIAITTHYINEDKVWREREKNANYSHTSSRTDIETTFLLHLNYKYAYLLFTNTVLESPF